MNRSPALVLAALASLAALGGCSIGGADRVGGQTSGQAHELTMITLFDEAKPFADEVSRLSGGALRIRIDFVEADGLDYERQVFRRMQEGEADLAAMGTRAWDDFGGVGLAALNAPFLVDSYPLQERIFTSDLVPTLLEELRPAGFQGIGILPGPLRRPLGLAGPLATPADFRGLTIGTQQSHVADATLTALGATPQRLPSDVAAPNGLTGVDGIELSVTGIENGRLDALGSHLMTNVNLWPRSIVLFAGDEAYRGLSDDERKILHDAVTNLVSQKTAIDRGFEVEAAANLCRKGNAAFDAASPRQLRALRRAVDPVYADLERDPDAREVIEAVEHLKAELAEPPSEVPACTPEPDAPSTEELTDLDGVWRMDTDRSAAAPDDFDENWGHWVFVLDRGRFAITQENETSCTWGYGTYAVNGTRMSWTFLDGGGIAPNYATNRPGEYFVFDFSAYRDTLSLTPVEGEISPLNFRAEPWRRLSRSPSRDDFSTRCSPPLGALER
jgi:TRAP-type C4-dicarboxylate transport system substrate-binding protein